MSRRPHVVGRDGGARVPLDRRMIAAAVVLTGTVAYAFFAWLMAHR